MVYANRWKKESLDRYRRRCFLCPEIAPVEIRPGHSRLKDHYAQYAELEIPKMKASLVL